MLVVLHAWRLLAFRTAMAADLADPGLGFGLFTFIGGTDVLGTRLAAAGHHRAAVVLLAAGWLAWLVPGYVVAVDRRPRPLALPGRAIRERD